MDRSVSPRALLAALAAFAFSQLGVAQSSVVAPECFTGGSNCVLLSGNVVFEPGVVPPAEANVRVSYPFGGTFASLAIRTPGPAYRFEATLARGVSPEIRLVDLPPPWLNDRALQLSPVDAPRTVQLRSDAGVNVTATFRFPTGTPPATPFTATVRRSDGDRWFTPVEVADGRFSFVARRGHPFAIAASPLGSGNVLAEFPAPSTDIAVTVDVERHVAPVAQSVVLTERGVSSDPFRRVLVPLVLGGPASSGGGEMPYDATVVADTLGARDVVALGVPVVGRRQRIALLPVQIRDDSIVNGDRVASIRLRAKAPGAIPVIDVPVNLVDDEPFGRNALMTVDGAEMPDAVRPSSTVLARREGGPGEGWDIVLRLESPAPISGAAVTVVAVAMPDVSFPEPFGPSTSVPGSVEGADFQPLNQRIVFAPGSYEARFRIEGIGNARAQGERRFALAFIDADGLVPRDPAIELRIVDDDLDDRSGARADRFAVPPDGPPALLDVLANDVLPAQRFTNGRVELLQAPVLGSATVETFGTATPLDDRVRYTPRSSLSGQGDRITYRICEDGGAVCVSSRVEVLRQARVDVPTAFVPDAAGGYRDIVVSGLPPLSDARVDVLARALTSDDRSYSAPPVPASNRFEPTWRDRLPLPFLPFGQSADRTVLVHAQGEAASDIDLYVAFDANGDELISTDEILCSSATTRNAETCLVRFRQTGRTSQLHIATVNFGAQWTPIRTVAAVLDDIGPLGGVAATAPTRLAQGESLPVRLSWSERSRLFGEGVIGLLRIQNADGSSRTDLPLVLDMPRTSLIPGPAVGSVPTVLVPGVPAEVNVPRRNSRLSRAFIDVPPGTGSLAVRVGAFSRWYVGIVRPVARVSLVHLPLSASGERTGIAPAPVAPADSGRISSTQALEITVASPAAGRWYMVLEDESLPDGDFGEPSLEQVPLLGITTMSASVIAATPAPAIRPGGYFNPSRSGHGLFLYPAGNDWAGLWYTYQQDGEPVWYYLQAAKPGANGIWTAPIYRSGWNGSRNHLTEVGRATITPTANDAFQFTYVLDGETGSEPFTSFGRGCPSIDGRVVDASGHWFDPARAGAGYSVQLLPNYEFHAVFAYSARGEPRFLVAERNGVGAANQTLPLQQLRGFCPLCTRSGDPQRATVGVLRREFVNGQLSRIAADAAFTNGTTGTWVVNDAVVPLGGLQGCSAN